MIMCDNLSQSIFMKRDISMNELLNVATRLEERIFIDKSILENPKSDFDKFLIQCDRDLQVAVNCIRYCADNLNPSEIKKLMT